MVEELKATHRQEMEDMKSALAAQSVTKLDEMKAFVTTQIDELEEEHARALGEQREVLTKELRELARGEAAVKAAKETVAAEEAAAVNATRMSPEEVKEHVRQVREVEQMKALAVLQHTEAKHAEALEEAHERAAVLGHAAHLVRVRVRV